MADGLEEDRVLQTLDTSPTCPPGGGVVRKGSPDQARKTRRRLWTLLEQTMVKIMAMRMAIKKTALGDRLHGSSHRRRERAAGPLLIKASLSISTEIKINKTK